MTSVITLSPRTEQIPTCAIVTSPSTCSLSIEADLAAKALVKYNSRRALAINSNLKRMPSVSMKLEMRLNQEGDMIYISTDLCTILKIFNRFSSVEVFAALSEELRSWLIVESLRYAMQDKTLPSVVCIELLPNNRKYAITITPLYHLPGILEECLVSFQPAD